MNNIQKADIRGHLCRIILTKVILVSKVKAEQMFLEAKYEHERSTLLKSLEVRNLPLLQEIHEIYRLQE